MHLLNASLRIRPLVPRPLLHSRNSPNQHNRACFREKWSLKTLLGLNVQTLTTFTLGTKRTYFYLYGLFGLE